MNFFFQTSIPYPKNFSHQDSRLFGLGVIWIYKFDLYMVMTHLVLFHDLSLKTLQVLQSTVMALLSPIDYASVIDFFLNIFVNRD